MMKKLNLILILMVIIKSQLNKSQDTTYDFVSSSQQTSTIEPFSAGTQTNSTKNPYTTTLGPNSCLAKFENLIMNYWLSSLNISTGYLQYPTYDLETLSVNYSFPVSPKNNWPVVCNKLLILLLF
jgi:hypothetical protein